MSMMPMITSNADINNATELNSSSLSSTPVVSTPPTNRQDTSVSPTSTPPTSAHTPTTQPTALPKSSTKSGKMTNTHSTVGLAAPQRNIYGTFHSVGVGVGVGAGLITPANTLEQYRLQLYNYALNIERFRCPPYSAAAMAAAAYANLSSGANMYPLNNANTSYTSSPGSRLALSMSLFPQRIFQPEEPKPQHSYIGLIAMAILSSSETKLVLSDIYQYILDNYPYFRSRGPGWRNSIRHNLSLNDCFIKSGRSANGKGHYWAIHPANMEDFRKGDFRRRKAQRKVRKHMGLSVDDAGTDSPSPPPLDLTSSPPPLTHQLVSAPESHTHAFGYLQQHHPSSQFPQQLHYVGQTLGSRAVNLPYYVSSRAAASIGPGALSETTHLHSNETTTTASVIANLYSQSRKRQFDVASLLAPDLGHDESIKRCTASAITTTQHTVISKVSVQHQQQNRSSMIQLEQRDMDTNKSLLTTVQQQQQEQHQHQLQQQQIIDMEEQEDIDVVASDAEESKHDNCNDNDDQDNSTLLCTTSRRSSLDTTFETHSSSLSSQQDSLEYAMSNMGTMDRHIFGRYYGTYMAARRVGGMNLALQATQQSPQH